MPFKAVRIDVLDEHGNAVEVFDESGQAAGFAVASGFFMQEVTGLYLYTCWHVVTGINLHNPVLPGARAPARRMSSEPLRRRNAHAGVTFMRKPSAASTFSTVVKLGLPEGDSAL